MIFGAGAGAMAHAAKAMRQIQERINRRVNKSLRRARTPDFEYTGYETQYTDFPCAYLCGTCGYFVDGDGEEGEEPGHACEACGDVNWIDLSVKPVVDRMREVEAQERHRIPTWVTVALVSVTFALIAAGWAVPFVLDVSWTFRSWTFGSWVISTLVSSLVVVPIVYFALRRPAALLLLGGREEMPARWHEPLDLPRDEESPDRTLQGLETQPAGETLTAPASGRECVAYQLCVLFDTPGDARPPEWALQEQRAEDIELGGELELAPEEYFLESPVELVATSGDEEFDSLLPDSDVDADVDTDELKKYLRQRGLFMTEGEYHFYEARLEPGEQVEVAEHEQRPWVVEHVSAPDGDGIPDLPERPGG